jgi:DNA-binding transcriptional LysR family regulator
MVAGLSVESKAGPLVAKGLDVGSYESISSMSLPLDSRQLRAFSALARTGSFTLAARELFLSQSAVSHSMKALEEDVGCRLLDRVGKKVFLTQAGEQLLSHAEKILREMKAARESLQQLGKWGKGRLRLGASTTACQYVIPRALTEFKKRFADCAISIEPGDTALMIEALMANRIDVAISLRPQSDEPLEFRHLFTDELQFLVSPAHPWAQNGHAPREEATRQNFILYNRSSLTARLIDEYFREERIVLNTVMELGTMEAIKELVKLNLGVSIVAPWIAREEIASGSHVALSMGRRKLKREWGILHLKDRRLGLPEETFITIAHEAVKGEPLAAAA